ncbi:AT hook domain-containing protein [Colletotrichum orchidophilum]|uniref:AT hook domain-containing protein n=1 Tax=Colletotrichum orchidophilum TaxID=1209926 RepID=A0A1G4AMK4_9PEZI|nr:AT hook domain-containing protein [Colletotrichum orchidophilum]OHE90418.1 AT hook domain-containing protein [Colletotrichum orchidophilum]
MAPARIIADSDDSENDFESGDSPLKPTTATIPSEGRSSDPVSVATNSTDPKFFQAIYTEQQRAAAGDPLSKPERTFASNVAAPSSLSAEIKSSLEKTNANISSPISVSDPVSGSNSANVKEPEVVDLTEVTTPKMTAHATPDDMWDVPSSPVGGQAPLATYAKSRLSASCTKRKRANNVDFTSPVAIEIPSQGSTQPFDAAPAARIETGKRARLGNPDLFLSAEDDVDMVVVPHAAAVSSFGDLVSGQKPVSICIEPQTLSASQRLEYEYHSVGPSPEDPAPSPTQPFSTLQAAARSSGATTIAYSTPSQTRVIGLPLASVGGHVTLDTVHEQTQEGFGLPVNPEATVEIQSSPDIISAASVRRKRKNLRDEPPKTTESHREDDGWDPDAIGFHRESYKPHLSRRRGSDVSREDEAGDLESNEIPVADMGPAAQLPFEEPISPIATKPKKRGRPRKSETAVLASPVPAETTTAPQIINASGAVKDAAESETATAATPQTKKKRGRPKKADKNAIESVQQANEKPHVPEAQHSYGADKVDTKTEGKHAVDTPSGKAAKYTKGEHVDTQQGSTADAGDGPREKGNDRVLQPVTPNAALKPGPDGLGPQSAAAERKVAAKKEIRGPADGDKSGTAGKADEKQRLKTPASSSATKPIYRVGLSKRSRIAPLLKSLKK